ncbi:hypothetical protein MMC11_005923 [Xylographa trunciseda]|nr:hypothetical protein [Xylographa trunciseda]
MDRAQWILKETLQKVRNSALHRLFHEAHYGARSQAAGTDLQQLQMTHGSLDELEQGLREPGRNTLQSNSVRASLMQIGYSGPSPIPLQERTTVRDAATQTDDRCATPVGLHNPHDDPPSIQMTLDPAIPPALHYFAEQDLGKVVVIMDGSVEVPVLLLQPGLIYMMKEIRSSKQVVSALEERSRIAVHAIQTANEDTNVSPKSLKESSIPEERIIDVEHETASAGDVKDSSWDQVLLIDQNLSSEKENLDLTRIAFVNTIERALWEAELLDPIPDPDDAWKAKEHLYNHSIPDAPEGEASKSSVVSADELFRRAALADLAEAHQNYMDHLDQFERRGEMYENDFHDYKCAVDNGTCSLTKTDFDRVYVENISNLTQWLRKTEAAYEAALENARRLKLLINEYDQESNFVSDVSDGYRESFEASICAVVDRRVIEKWNEQVPTPKPSEHGGQDAQSLYIAQPDLMEVDPWDAKSVGLSSSVSMKDETRNRRRIDRWRQQCGL